MDRLSARINYLWRDYAIAASVANRDCPLLALPREIRDMIWQYAIVQTMQDNHDKLLRSRKDDESEEVSLLEPGQTDNASVEPSSTRPSWVTIESSLAFTRRLPRSDSVSLLPALYPKNLLTTCNLMRVECGSIWYKLMRWEEYSHNWEEWTSHNGEFLTTLLHLKRWDGRSAVHVYLPEPDDPSTASRTRIEMFALHDVRTRRRRQRIGRVSFSKELGWEAVVWVERVNGRWCCVDMPSVVPIWDL